LVCTVDIGEEAPDVDLDLAVSNVRYGSPITIEGRDGIFAY
jgi:hypothetical protein